MGRRLSIRVAVFAAIISLPPGNDAIAAAASVGTGFAVTADGLLVTNDHVTVGCTEVVAAQGGSRYAGGVVARDEANDLALVQLRLPDRRTSSFATLRQSPALRAGEQAITYGFPLRGALSVEGNLTIGYVSALRGLRDNPHYIQMTTPVQPGNSGGALLDASGNVIGVVAAKLNAGRMLQTTGDVPQNVNFAVELETLKTFLLRRGVKIKDAGSSREISPADIGERARQFTYLVACLTPAARPARNVAIVNVPPAQGAGPIQMVPEARREPAATERAFLQEVDAAGPHGSRHDGRSVWRAQLRASEAAAEADIEFPEQSLAMRWSLRRNSNPALEVSHTIELSFRVAPGFAHEGIASVTGISTRRDEQGEGTALAGAAVELSNGLFVFGLSAAEGDRRRNFQLLGDNAWIEIAIDYKDGRHAVLAIRKGDPGTRAVQAALAPSER
jgi:hypothetical protein